MLTLFNFKFSIYLTKIFFKKLVCVHSMKDWTIWNQKTIVLIQNLHCLFSSVFSLKWEEFLVDSSLSYTINLEQFKGQEFSVAQRNKKLHIWALETCCVYFIVYNHHITFTWYSTGLRLSCHVVCKKLFHKRLPILLYHLPLRFGRHLSSLHITQTWYGRNMYSWLNATRTYISPHTEKQSAKV